MDKIAVLTLIATTETRDSINQPVKTETTRTVYGKMKSVTRAEWVAAAQKSLNPSAVVEVFFADYCGETVAELDGKRYEIYRTFGCGDYIELYLGTKVGV
jgi:hypothetical protein